MLVRIFNILIMLIFVLYFGSYFSWMSGPFNCLKIIKNKYSVNKVLTVNCSKINADLLPSQ